MVKIIDEVMKELPPDSDISEALFEAANIVLYTKNKDFLFDNKGIIKKIVDDLKKRVEVRADPSIVMDIEDAKETIKKILPTDTGEVNIIFDPQRSRVIIEAEKPGLAIGKGGDILKEIKKATLWTAIVRRIPPMRSQLIENIRQVLYDYSDYRRKFLHKVGKRIYEGWTKSKRDEWIRLTCLGSAREVGRSCFLLQTPESKILLDCGYSVSAPREYAFPYLDAPEFNINELDAVIISHAHIDHVGTLSYLYKMGYKGPVYMSVDYKEPIIIKENGIIKKVKIGEFVDNIINSSKEIEKLPYYEYNASNINNEIEAAAFSNLDYKINFKKIKKVIRHKICNGDRLYKISLKTGKSIQVTGSHSIFILKNGEVVEAKVSNIKEGDYVVVPQKLPVSDSIEELDLKEILNDFKCDSKYIYSKSGRRIPRKIKICKELLRILGYFTAEGSFDKRSLEFNFGLKDINYVNELERDILNVFGIKPITKIDRETRLRLRLNSKLIRELFYRYFFKNCKKAIDKKVPEIVFNVNNSLKEEFLRAYYNGDGTINIYNKTAVANSVSKELISDLCYICSQIGISYTFYEMYPSPTAKTKNKVYQLTINLKEFFENESISICNLNLIPLKEVGFNEEWYYHRLKTKIRVSKDRLISLLESNFLIYKNSMQVKEKLVRIANSDLAFLSVTKIEEVLPTNGFVYDISVDGDQNFVAGDSPICLHNTAPTRDVSALLCLDMIEIAMKEGSDHVYDSNDVKEMVKHTICLDYEEVSDITPDVRLTLYDAGHNLGSSMIHLHIGNGLHNFVYSLDGSTKIVLLDKDNNPEFVEIGKFIDSIFEEKQGMIIDNGFIQEIPNTKGYGTIAFNPKTLKSEIVNITSFVRHPTNEEVYEIKTESGRSIKVTKSHSVFSAKNGKVASIEVSKLNKGDFIIGSKRIPSLHRNEPVIDLLPYLGEMRISLEENVIKQIISEHKKDFNKLIEIDQGIAEAVLTDHYNGIHKKYISKKHNIHTRRVYRILNTLKVKSQPRVSHIFKDKIRINKDLARFLGYYISEGNPSKKDQTIHIANDNNEILEDCYKIIKKEFGIDGDLRYNDHCIIFSSKQLKYLLCKVLKCGKNAYEKRVPKELLLADKDIISDLLYGLFSGDSGIRVRAKGREISYGSKSKGLIDDISFMLLQFGIVPTREYNKYCEMHNIHIYNAEKIIEFLAEININNSQNQLLVQELLTLKQNKASFDSRIPINSLSITTQEVINKSPWQNATSCGLNKLEDENLTEEDLNLINSDLLFDKIKSIEKIQSTRKYVYDLRIDGYENFLGGEGFLFMHNTGDFNYETSNLLGSAASRFPRVETVMMESTYGTKSDTSPTRRESEEELIKIINETAQQQGKVLMPVLGVGRSQEILLILERAMTEKKIPEMPVYVQGMVWDVTAIHTAYPDYLSARVKKAIFQRDHNPLLSPIFKKVVSQKEMQEIKDSKGPFIVMATSGMLQGGPSLEYFKHFAENPKNCVVLTSYQGVGSIGRRIQDGEREMTFVSGGSKRVDTIHVKLPIYILHGFSGHSNFKQLTSWVHHLEPRPKKFIMIHGDYSRCIELASVVYQQNRVETVAPKNLETIRLR